MVTLAKIALWALAVPFWAAKWIAETLDAMLESLDEYIRRKQSQ